MAGLFALCLGSCSEQKPCTEVNWATFNIRYANPNDSLDFWGFRKDTVASFILANDLDIVGMQEVLQREFYLHLFSFQQFVLDEERYHR